MRSIVMTLLALAVASAAVLGTLAVSTGQALAQAPVNPHSAGGTTEVDEDELEEILEEIEDALEDDRDHDDDELLDLDLDLLFRSASH